MKMKLKNRAPIDEVTTESAIFVIALERHLPCYFVVCLIHTGTTVCGYQTSRVTISVVRTKINSIKMSLVCSPLDKAFGDSVRNLYGLCSDQKRTTSGNYAQT